MSAPAQPTPARILVVDDEPLARKRIRRLLAARHDIEVIGESENGLEAVASIKADPPDLVLLDIQMPDLDGFGVLAAVGPENMPAVIFVTAYDEYALDAFEVSALDYLLKPFEGERLESALDKALARLRERRFDSLEQRLSCLLEGHLAQRGEATPPDSPAKKRRRITVHRQGKIFFVPVAAVDWLEAEGAYVRLHVGGRSHLVRDSLKNFEKTLDPEQFVRIHRSTIVRLDRVSEMQPLFHGEYQVVLTTGAELKLSRGYRAAIDRLVAG